MDWTTIALIALAIAAGALILWAIIFALMARHVIRFQNRVADDILGNRHTTPGPGRNATTRRAARARRERGEL